MLQNMPAFPPFLGLLVCFLCTHFSFSQSTSSYEISEYTFKINAEPATSHYCHCYHVVPAAIISPLDFCKCSSASSFVLFNQASTAIFQKSGHFFVQNSAISRFAQKRSRNACLSLQGLGSLLAHHHHLYLLPALLCPTNPSTDIILASLFLEQAARSYSNALALVFLLLQVSLYDISIISYKHFVKYKLKKNLTSSPY